MKKILRKIVPKFLLNFYHRALAGLAAFVYGYPSRQMIVIGVTGTGGKSTVVNLIGKILEEAGPPRLGEAGHTVGWTTTFNFKIARREWINTTKMTMLGRFGLQKMLRQMVKAGCDYAIVETSSEGILQSRHLGIDYDVAVFNNLHREHLERHGGFEKYRAAKGKLFARLISRRKTIAGRPIKKISVVNLDDAQAEYFLQFPADEYYGFTIAESSKDWPAKIKVTRATKINLHDAGADFEVAGPPRLDNSLVEAGPPRLGEAGQPCKIHLLGRFNVINALAAIAVAVSQGVDLAVCGRALEKIISMAGRMEVVSSYPFKVVVDYAHTPDEVEAVYKTFKKDHQRLICVLGAAGGGRDKWKRPEFGRIADNYAAEIIITNEDPYDEDPQQIIEQVAAGVVRHLVHKILDRREAIKLALSLSRPSDVVIITGKGSEQCIMGPAGQRIPWNDRQAVCEILAKTEQQTKIS